MAAIFGQFPANFGFSGALFMGVSRAPENLKFAGNWPKMAEVSIIIFLKHIFVVFKLIISIIRVFMHLILGF